MSIEDQNSVFRNLSTENFEDFHRSQVRFYQSLAAAWVLSGGAGENSQRADRRLDCPHGMQF